MADGYRAAFDMPTTPEQALKKLAAWGSPLTMTFNPEHAARCAELLSDALLRQSKVPTVVREVLAELARATAKFPSWPTDPLHAVAVVGEEAGELTKAVLQAVYEPHKNKSGDVRAEAIQTAAMAIRFLLSLDRYEFTGGIQHKQTVD